MVVIEDGNHKLRSGFLPRLAVFICWKEEGLLLKWLYLRVGKRLDGSAHDYIYDIYND